MSLATLHTASTLWHNLQVPAEQQTWTQRPVAALTAGGRFTGAVLNPARVIGPLAVFKCGKDVAW